MKPHPRIRKTVKWGGAAVTVLLVVVWIGSASTGLRADLSPFTSVRIDYGCVVWIVESRPSFNPGFLIGRPMHAPRSMIVWWSPGPSLNPAFHYVPLWPVVAFAIGAVAVVWRLDTLPSRRARLGLCPKCGYDRTGLRGGAGAVCPECGAAAKSAG